MGYYKTLGPDYQEKCLEKWQPLLEASGSAPIANEQIALATAIVLQNTEEANVVSESYTGGINQTGNFGAQIASGPGGGALGTNFNMGDGDARMPTVVIPTVRRIFPNLLAHNIAGVQPMNGPVGFAFALRAIYGANGKGSIAEGQEMGYNEIDSAFAGASSNAFSPSSNGFWESFAGAGTTLSNGVNTYGEDGQAATLGDSEWWNIGEDMPMAKLQMEKGTVTARSRKLAAAFSLEIAEDMMSMHGIDVDNEMVNIISYEIQAEIDRQLLTEMVKAAIDGGKTSVWSPVSADGRNQLERIGTLYTHVLDKANEIAITTRRGPATFAVASPKVCSVMERLQDFTLDQASSQIDTGAVGIAKVGVLRNGSITLYRDTFAMGDYIFLGYKGPTPYDAGIIYCPYIPVQLLRATAQENFSPRMGVRTRYGILSHLFGAENYYHFVRVDGLTNTAVNAADGRLFTM